MAQGPDLGSAGLVMCLRLVYAQIPADLATQNVAQLNMAGNSRTCSALFVPPPRMLATFANELTAILAQVR